MNKYGFIPDEHKIEDWVFGAGEVEGNILQPDGDWTKFLPKREIQRQHGLETMNCTVYGTTNAIEMIMKRRLPFYDFNYSERYTGVLAETTPQGNSPHKVAEVIRKKGLITDTQLPFDEEVDSWDDYYYPDPMWEEYIELGLEWLDHNHFAHDWVFTPSLKKRPDEKIQLIKDSLKYSPLGISVQAWRKNDDGVYIKDRGTVDNHWCVLFKQDNEYNYIYDSYDSTIKKLSLDYDFQFAKRYVVRSKQVAVPPLENESIFRKIINFINRFLDKLKIW